MVDGIKKTKNKIVPIKTTVVHAAKDKPSQKSINVKKKKVMGLSIL